MRRKFGLFGLGGVKVGLMGAGGGRLEWSVWKEISRRVYALNG